MPTHEEVLCPRCNAGFECKSGSITICHCSDIALNRDQMAYIAERWQSCLCHQCLLELKASLPEQHAVLKPLPTSELPPFYQA